MPRLPICSCDLHWQWINWALLYDTMEVSMFRLAWLTIAQHVFQPTLTGRLVSCEPRTKAIAVSRFRKNCLLQIGSKELPRFREKYRALGRQKNGVQHATAIYPIPRYTPPPYIGSTLYMTLKWCREWPSFLLEDKDLFILHSQNHGCWWPCETRGQGISSHSINLILNIQN